MKDNKVRTFLDPLQTSKRIRRDHYKTVQSGEYAGYRITRFESRDNRAAFNFRNGILVEPPPRNARNMQPMTIFGEYHDVKDISGRIKDDPEKVMRSLRPTSMNDPRTHSNYFYLNAKPKNTELTNQLHPSEMKQIINLKKTYDSPAMDEDRLMTREDIEKQALDQHRDSNREFDAMGQPIADPASQEAPIKTLVSR